MVFNYGSVIFFKRDQADSGLFSLCSSLFWSEIQTIKWKTLSLDTYWLPSLVVLPPHPWLYFKHKKKAGCKRKVSISPALLKPPLLPSDQ